MILDIRLAAQEDQLAYEFRVQEPLQPVATAECRPLVSHKPFKKCGLFRPSRPKVPKKGFFLDKYFKYLIRTQFLTRVYLFVRRFDMDYSGYWIKLRRIHRVWTSGDLTNPDYPKLTIFTALGESKSYD